MMLQDLKRLAEYQTSLPEEMQLFVNAANYLADKKEREGAHWDAARFFELSMAKLKKMFAHWLDKRPFFLSAFGEHLLGQIIARYLTQETNSRTLILLNVASMYTSSFHQSFTHPTREIDLVAFGEFIALECREEVRQSHHAIENSQALQQIASGLNIWRPNAQAMAMELLSKYGGLPVVTHHLEQVNKNHNICSANGRGERAINARMSAHLVLLEVTWVTTVDGKREPSSGPKFVKHIYGNLKAHLETIKIIGRDMPTEQQKEWDDYICNKLYNKQEIFE
jgi:hypothetical protein